VKQALFPLSELEPGKFRAVTVDGLDVVVVRQLDGSIHALRDRCAHSGARLSHGRLIPKVVGADVDTYQLTKELVLRCPWHGYEYDVATGRCLADPKHVRTRTYTVTVDDGTVWFERRSVSDPAHESPGAEDQP
jgi:3-phenylpropionate/trans-cinnamate dioxygenase ferredoxin subunit